MRSDLTVILALATVFGVYGLVSATVANVRAQRLGPMCAAHGWVLVDNNMNGPAKCWDPKTNLMYLPPEVFSAR